MTTARLAIALLLSYGSCVPVSDHRKRQDAAFDYVIVGGGTAGLTLAARLSEDPSTSVAVIEAGTYYSVSDPLLASTPAGDTVGFHQLNTYAEMCTWMSSNRTPFQGFWISVQAS